MGPIKTASLQIAFETDGICLQHVDRLEHVIVKLTMDFSRRGNLKITLTSPSGTESVILDHRPNDDSNEGFSDFEFLTVQFWDEPILWKNWTIKFEDVTGRGHTGLVNAAELILYGTSLSRDGHLVLRWFNRRKPPAFFRLNLKKLKRNFFG